MFEALQVVPLLLKDPEFTQASEDLESTDRAVFDAAQLTIQRLLLKAIDDLVAKCDHCYMNRLSGRNFGMHYCEVHADMIHETKIMLTDECDDPDKPVFQGVS